MEFNLITCEFKGEGVNSLVIEVVRQGKLPSPENFGAESLQLLGPVCVGLKFDKTNLAYARLLAARIIPEVHGYIRIYPCNK